MTRHDHNHSDAGSGVGMEAVMEDGWIEWNGGKCPVEPGTRVEVKFRDGSRLAGPVFEGANWTHSPFGSSFSGADVIAYRIVKPSSPTRSLIE